MSDSDELKDYTKKINEYILCNEKRTAKFDMTLQQMVESNKNLSENVGQLLTKITSLEISSLAEIGHLKRDVNGISGRLNDLSEVVTDLEKRQSKDETIREESDKTKKFWSDNWYKILLTFCISIPVIVGLYGLVTGMKGD